MKRLLVLLLLLTMMVSNLLIPRSVYATTVTLTVNGDGATDTAGNEHYTGGAANFTNLQSDDGDTTTYYTAPLTPNAPRYHAWDYTNTAVTGVNSVTAYFKAKDVPSFGGSYNASYYIVARIGGTNYLSTNQSIPADNTYYLQSYTWSVSPATGLTWTAAEISAAQFGVYVGDSLYSYPLFTYSYVVVDYVATAPVSTTVAASSILNTSATLNGTLDSTGDGVGVTNYGFVWDTVSRADPGNTAPAASAYANNWTIGAGTYSLGAVLHSTGATLAANTTYYFRVAAVNAIGWAYGVELSFKTVGIPTGTTDVATLVATVTARINASVTNDNGQLCDVRFGYDTVTRATVALYANITPWVNDTYATGTFPYVDLTGLALGTPYFFRVEIRNDAGSVEGAEQTFTTGAAIGAPSGIVAIPSSTSVSLLWVKGTYAAYTLIRVSTGAYPTLVTEGTLVYLNTNNSYNLTGLTEGTTYYVSFWGKTSTFYSAAYTTTLTTTTGYTVPGGASATVTGSTSEWMQSPSSVKASGIPLIGGLVTAIAAAYNQPEEMMWYFIWLLCSAAVGVIIFVKSNNNLMLAAVCTAIAIGAGMVIGLTMMWIISLLIIIVCGFVIFAQRY